MAAPFQRYSVEHHENRQDRHQDTSFKYFFHFSIPARICQARRQPSRAGRSAKIPRTQRHGTGYPAENGQSLIRQKTAPGDCLICRENKAVWRKSHPHSHFETIRHGPGQFFHRFAAPVRCFARGPQFYARHSPEGAAVPHPVSCSGFSPDGMGPHISGCWRADCQSPAGTDRH